MKKVLKYKLYDTDTARKLATWSTQSNDFNYIEESLYRKRTGEYFLHGIGGANSKYARSVGQNFWSGGEKIIPLTVESAMQWAEEHLDADEYGAIFGIPDESADPVMFTFRVPADFAAQVRRTAEEKEISLGELIIQALKQYIN